MTHNNKNLLAIISLVFLNFCAVLQPAIAADTKCITDWLIVPVFFATNRSSAGDTGPIDYLEKPNEKLIFGIKNIACPVPVNSPLTDATRDRMHWQKVHIEPKDVKNVQRFQQEINAFAEKSAIKNKRLERSEIVPAFASYMKETDSKENVLFVHGCCVDFDTAMERAAMLSAHMESPVLLYDWVSPKGFRNYLQNGTRAEQTMDNFCRFLASLEKATDPAHVTVVGHSMGNQFVDEAMLRRYGQNVDKSSVPQFKEIIMANADIDAQSFINHVNDVAANAKITRIYVSSKDGRMNSSAWVHGGFNRLGSPGALITRLSGIDHVEVIDTTAANSGHELLYWLVSNMHNDGNIGPVKDFALKQTAPGYLTLVKPTLAKQKTAEKPTGSSSN